MVKTNSQESHGGDSPASSVSEHVHTHFFQFVQDASRAMKHGDFALAARLYTDAIILDPANHVLYSNRSAAHLRLNQWDEALHDARKCKQMKPDWSKGYLREAAALKQMGRHADALASFCVGLSLDPQNRGILQSLRDALADSTLKDRFAPFLDQLVRLKQDENPFLVTSVIGQELLKMGKHSASVLALDAALHIGTTSLLLKGSVLSALSSAHWGLGNVDKAITFMQQDLATAKAIGDLPGECRSYANLGAAYFSKGDYKVAFQYRRLQLTSVIRLKDYSLITSALSHLGHVCSAVGDYRSALLSHKRCALLAKQKRDRLVEAREIGSVGAVYLAGGDIARALECHQEHLGIAREIGNQVEEARAYSNLGSAYHYQRQFDRAIAYHEEVLRIAALLGDQTLEARAYSGLGHAARCMRDYPKAKHYHEKQLDNALQTKDKMAEGRSCSNLGIVYQLLGEYEAALKLHKAHLQISKDLGDRVGQGRAYGNIGNAYSALGQFELAIRFHKQELAISKEVRDRHAESSTHGNLAFAYQALRMKDQALHSYSTHLSMAQALRDKGSESRALCNIGNYLCAMKLYDQALPYYEKFLALSEELGDKEGWGTACHGLGYVHYRLGNFAKAVGYYEKDLVLARGLLDKSHVCRALCNLGLAQKALGSYRDSLDSQRQFLAVASELKNVTGKFCALGNVGDVLLHIGEGSEAVKMFNQQLHLARISNDRKLEAISLGNLGNCCRMLDQLDKALSYHMQELTIYQDLTNNPKAESQAHGCIGNIHMTLGNYMSAYRSYEEQLDRSRESGDVEGEAMAYGNMGITKMNARMYEDAIGFFEQQLALLEQLNGSRTHAERGRATRNMGDCYDAIGEHREAIRCYESYLAMNANSLVDQNRAYHSLGCAYQATGSLHQALICFEKRLVIAHSLGDLVVVGRAYGELGCLHSLTGNFEQAINYLQHQRRIARDIGDPIAEAEAACALGGVYHQMAEFEKALEYHLIDLELSTKMRDASCQCRAFGNLGLSNESLGRYEEAVAYQLKLLHVASEIKDNAAKTLALTSLGRVYHAVGRYPEAIDSLRQGLKIALDGGQKEDEAKIRHRLGLALWLEGSFEDAQQELYLAVELFESIRRESQYNNDYKMSLFELQTASYQALQRVLVALDRPDEALLVAERARTRAFIDLVLERQNLPSQLDSWYSGVDSSPVTMETIQRTIDQQKCAVLYYSLAAGYLYSWLILPQKGVVKFHESIVAELDELSVAGSDVQSTSTVLTASAITGCISRARESLGIESHLSASRTSLTKGEADDPDLEGRLVQLGDRLNAEKDAVGFLRMTNRSHAWNCSSFSIGSLVSIGSGPNDAERHRVASFRSAASRQTARDDGTKAPLIRLYDLLIGVMEDFLPPTAGCAGCKELVLVLQGDLYLVPFALLRPTQSAACLYERYSLLVAPSVRAMQAAQAISDRCQYNPNCSGAIVVGNPKIPACITAAWHWRPLPATEQECRFVAEMLGCRSLTGSDATRDAVSRDMPQAEVIHFATHISWKLSAIVLARNGSDRKSSWDERSNAIDDSFDGPALSEHLLTAADILNVPIRAKLVVINSSHMDERAGRMNSDGVIGLTRAFLAAGAQCVLFPLWGVPEGASRLLLRNFYRCLLHGTSTSSALAEAMRAVRATRQFAHPSNWACWTLVGSNVRISSKVALMGHGLKALLSTPTKSREAMRVVLHLVEKALQRIQTGQRNAMYMTRSSIENRVGDVSGWQDILVAMGFRFESEPANGQAATVFFPTSDPGERLTQCSASLQALLGLSVPSLICLAKIKELPDVGRILTSLLKDFLGRFPRHTTKTSPSLIVGIEVWKRSGTHEFLASLGFELVEVGNDEVTVRLGKNASRRVLHYSLQALMAVFDVQDAPRVLLESSSSMESLVSTSESVTSPISNLGSSPPVSPLAAAKKSYFNPAEVDKLPSAMKNLVSTGSKSSLCPSASGPDLNLQLAHQTLIRSKYSSPSTSDMSDANMTYDQRSTVTPGREDNERGGKQRSGPMSVKMRTSQGQGYSTSASDCEDVWACPDGAGVLGGRSRTGGTSSGSQGALQLSGRTGGNGGRRMRPRVQASGNRVAAGEGFVAGRDMTSLSGELYDLNVAMDSLTDSGIQSTPKQTDSNTDHSTDREDSALGKHGTSMVRGIRNQATGDNLTLRPLPTSEVPRSLPDFGTVAQKVLADTDRCREVVEAIQNVPRNTVPSERGRNLEKLHLSGGGRTGQNVSCLSNGSDEAVHLLLGEIKSIPGFTGQVPPLGFRHKPDSLNGCESQISFGKKQVPDSSRSHVQAMENLHQSNKASNSKPQFGKNRSVVLEGGLIARSEQPNSSTRSVGHESKGFQPCSRAKGHHNAGNVCRTFDSDGKFLRESESKVTPLQNRLIPNSASESSSFHKNAHPLSLTGVPRNTSNVLHRPSFVFPDAVRNRPFPSQEDLAAPYVANFPPTVLKDALANIPPPLPGRYRPLLPKPTTWDARSCDFNSPRSLQKASALFFRNNSDWSAFSRPKQTTGKANENTPGHSELPQNRNSNAHLNLGYLSSEPGDKPTLCVLEEESSPSDNSWVGRPQPASSSRYIEGTETTSQKAETSSRVRMLSENFNATVEDGVVRSKPWQQTTSVSSQPRQNVRADLIANANAALHASRC